MDTIEFFLNGGMPSPELENLSGISTWGDFLQRNNILRGAGNNTHAGGGNGGAPGASDLLSSFLEPPEGIDDPENNGKRLMAVNGNQIDGTDDYALHYLSLPESGRRDAHKIYESQDLSRNILERLDGYYHVADFDSGKEIFYHQVASGLQSALSGDSMTDVDVNYKQKTIRVIFWPHTVAAINAFGSPEIPSQVILWHVITDSSNIPLELTSDADVLLCQKNQYLKLICSNSNLQFSLSLNIDRKIIQASEQNPAKLSFRFTRKIEGEKQIYIDHRYGAPTDSGNNAKAWRIR